MVKNTCQICGAEIIEDWRKRKTCGSPECQKELKRRYQNNKYDSFNKRVDDLDLDD
jgi:hypothetical protein